MEIGKTGFEPATPWSQTRCSTKLSYFPFYAPSRSRTYNLLIRSQTLYPIALWVHFHYNAEDRGRTGTEITLRRILSPVRLPIPPPRQYNESGRRDSNPRPPPWQGDVLPLNYFRISKLFNCDRGAAFRARANHVRYNAGEGTRTPTVKNH